MGQITIETLYAILVRVEPQIKDMHNAIYGNGGDGLKDNVQTNESDIKWIKAIGGKIIWFFSAITIGIVGCVVKLIFF